MESFDIQWSRDIRAFSQSELVDYPHPNPRVSPWFASILPLGDAVFSLRRHCTVPCYDAPRSSSSFRADWILRLMASSTALCAT